MTTYEFCKVEREGKLTIVTMNRPDVMNSLHPPANFELEKVFNDFSNDPSQWVAILTGAGDRAFSAGNDLKFTASGGKMEIPATGFAGLTARYHMNKPLIAAVNGVAMGGGMEIALACDIIIASDKARFALPEPKVGLAAGAGGVHRLPRQIGLKHAMGMILTGRHVSAEEGYRLGFINEVVPHADVMKAARRWAAEIMECSPMSVRASKEMSMQGLAAGGIEAACNGRYEGMSALAKSKDFIEGPRAFAEKRKPNWADS
jgi:enoyl-CoA hydratase/carnithine racemase